MKVTPKAGVICEWFSVYSSLPWPWPRTVHRTVLEQKISDGGRREKPASFLGNGNWGVRK